MDKLSNLKGPGGINYLNLLPDFTSNWDLALAVFIMPVAVQWWAVWYPGAEPGGGSYIAQRMLASKSEKDAVGAVLTETYPGQLTLTDPATSLALPLSREDGGQN